MKAIHIGYHYIRNSGAPGISCTPKQFKNHIERLQSEGYEFLTCGEIARLARRKTLPDKVACLSFDDGLKDHYTTALPIMKEMQVKGTFFPITCTLGNEAILPPVTALQIAIKQLGAQKVEEILRTLLKGCPFADLLDEKRFDVSDRKMVEPKEMRRVKYMFNYFPAPAMKLELLEDIFHTHIVGDQKSLVREWFMGENELCEMEAAGMEIGSHTVTHPALDVTGARDIRVELIESRQTLDDILTKPVETFAWTFGGNFREKARSIAADLYESSWNYNSKLKAMPEDPYADLTNIPRLDERFFLSM